MMERETGLEPATNSLEGCDSTTELLPPNSCQSSVVSRLLLPCILCIYSLITENGPLKTELLELMTRIELVTSPLPRECSTN